MIKPYWVPLLLTFLLTFLLTSCGGNPQEFSEGAPGPSQVRFLHGISDLGPLEIWMDGEIFLTEIRPGQLTNSLDIPPGSHNIDLREQGAQVSLLREVLSFGEGTDLVSLLGSEEDNTLEFWVVDPRPPQLAPGQAAVAVAVMYGGANPVEVWVGGTRLTGPTETYTVYPFQLVQAGENRIEIFIVRDPPISADFAVPLHEGPITLRGMTSTLILLMRNQPGGYGLRVLDFNVD